MCNEQTIQQTDFANQLITKQAAIDALRAMQTYKLFAGDDMLLIDQAGAQTELMMLPPARPEQPPYVAEIEAEYQKAVKMPHIHKPLAKALYEVWKKHDREDVERRTDG